MRRHDFALAVAAALLVAIAISLAGCTTKATYTSLAMIDTAAARFADGLAVYVHDKEVQIATNTPLAELKPAQVAWRVKSHIAKASAEAIHAAVVEAKDAAKDIAAGIRDKADLAKFVMIAMRTLAEGVAILTKYGIKIPGVN